MESKDFVQLLNLQDIGTSAPRSSHGGIDESFGVMRQEKDAVSSTVSIASEHRDELEKRVALQADELSSRHQVLNESDATGLKPQDDVSSLQAQPNRGFDPTEETETDSEQGQARGKPIKAVHPLVDDFSSSREMAFHENLNSKIDPAEWQREGTDWVALFNPNIKRTLDITLVKTFNYNSPVRCVRLSPDMRYLSAASGATVHVYDAETCAEISMFATSKMVNIICFSPDSSILAVGSDDEDFYVLTTSTWEIRYTFGGNTGGIASLCFSPDGELLVAGTYNNDALIWSLEDGVCKTVSANSGSLHSISLSPNGSLAMGYGNGSIEIWNQRKKNPELIETVLGHESVVTSLAFIPYAGKGLLSASEDKSLKYWDVSPLLGSNKSLAKRKNAAADGLVIQCIKEFTGHQECIMSFAISHHNQWVVSGSEDNCVQFWDLEKATSHCMLVLCLSRPKNRAAP